MKILFITLGIFQDKGGIGKFNQRVIRVLSNLVSSGEVDEFSVISLWDYQEELEINYQNINIRGLNRNKVKTFWVFMRYILSHKYSEILFAHVLFYPLFVISSLFSRKSKRILFVHGIDVWDKPTKIKGLIVSNLIDKIISVSNFTINKMVGSYGIDERKFHLLYNAIDFEESDENLHIYHEPDTFQLLSVSRLCNSSKHKNIDQIIIALPDILKIYPMVRYNIVGDGNWKSELQELSRTLQMNNKITFLGRISEKDLEDQYKTADIFVLPSVGEGFGIVFLEAWNHHLPIITSNQGAAPEIIRDRLEGLCIEPTPDEITKAIFYLLSNPEVTKKMGNSGYLRLKEHFTHEKFDHNLQQILLQKTKS